MREIERIERPFHKGVAFRIKNGIHILNLFFLKVLKEDLEVYREKDFT